MPKPLKSFDINGETFNGYVLDGRARGEQVSLPLEGDQSAAEMYAIPEGDLQRFYDAVAGKVRDVANGLRRVVGLPHFTFDRLYAVDVTFRPFVPLTTNPDGSSNLDGRGLSDETLYMCQYYALWLAEIRYAEDRGWVDDWRTSTQTASVDVQAPAAGANKPYTQKALVNLPEANVSITRRRVPRENFDPQAVNTAYGRRVNSVEWTLPWSGKKVAPKCAQFITAVAKANAPTYGPQYWTVTVEFLVQPTPWDQEPHRDSGTPVTLTRVDGSPLFQTADFNALFAN